jgi:hypothetical protein
MITVSTEIAGECLSINVLNTALIVKKKSFKATKQKVISRTATIG